MFRNDTKYDLVIPINYNYQNLSSTKGVQYLFTLQKTIEKQMDVLL